MEQTVNTKGERKARKPKQHIIFDSEGNYGEDYCLCCGSKGFDCDCTRDNLEDERRNLDKELEGRILVIASLGLWNGRKQGYKTLGNNLNEIVDYFDCTEMKIYVEDGKVLGRGVHHDGTNHYEFREIREDRNIHNLLRKIYNADEDITRSQLNYYTKSLAPYVKNIYGW